MPSSKTNVMNRSQVLAAVRATPPSKDFTWDGVSEVNRPATVKELQAGIATKEQVVIRFDHDVLASFRTAGPG